LISATNVLLINSQT